MIEDGSPPVRDVISFGPFRLIIAERLLEKDGTPLHIGGRALDLLIVLVEHAGKVVGKQELVSRIWPDVIVDESSLRFHMAALRKALGDGQAGARYLSTSTGRGYSFVASISRSEPTRAVTVQADDRPRRLPARLMRMVGRDEIIDTIWTQLNARRFVSIVGTGGIGKTTVAAAVSDAWFAAFDQQVHFIDLGDISDPRLVPSAVASAFGLPVRSSEPVPDLVQFLRDKRMLLVLDSCEHVIEAAAVLAERIFAEAQQVHLLATSREPLRVEGEHVQRLPPLSYPSDASGLLAQEALEFPAIQLFVERAAASDAGFALNNADAPVVGEICRKLDGIALAIELAAGRVSTYGIREVDALLNSRFELLWRGRRTAPARHQTLNATLDWSYNLLSEVERLVLRRLSIFTGVFTLGALQSIAPGDDLEKDQVTEAIASLVGKSLLTARAGHTLAHFRLLETTRVYALKLLAQGSELDAMARRHATYFCDLLESINAGAAASRKTKYEDHVDNVRSALDWSFSPRGEIGIGIALAAASAPMFLEMSLSVECHDWCRRAIGALDHAIQGTRREMELQARLGQALMFTPGKNEEVRRAFARGLEIADGIADSDYQLRFIEGLRIVDIIMGDCRSALILALRFQAIAKATSDSAGITKADTLLAISYHLFGDQLAAQIHCEAALRRTPQHRSVDSSRFYIDDINHAFCTLSRVLWLRGNVDRAALMAREAVEEARARGHAMILHLTLSWLLPAFFWAGDWPIVEEYVGLLIANSGRSSLILPLHGESYQGYLAVKRGDPCTGVDLLRRYAGMGGLDRYVTPPMFVGALAEGLAMTGRFSEALTIIDSVIPDTNGNGGLIDMPEMLRIKAGILMAMPEGNPAEAENCLFRSLELAHSQSALSWELRTATSLGKLLLAQGRIDQARDLLGPIYSRFTEGFGTPDLQSAKRLLDELSKASASDKFRNRGGA
jgi:predicted ATPase/DNA-binding winged helix-turn-helix (wHTH) protein